MRAQTVQQIVDQVLRLPEGSRLLILAPIVRHRKGEYRKELEQMKAEVGSGGEKKELGEAPPPSN